MVITAFVIAQTAIQKGGPRQKHGMGPILIYIAGWIIFARILYDRPGSARFGESGGLGEALAYAMAALAFWGFYSLSRQRYEARDALRALFVITILSCILHLVRSGTGGLAGMLFSLFHRPFWLASAIAITLVYDWKHQRKFLAVMPLLYLGVIGGILATSAVSAHRSRPLFAVAIILTVAWIHKRFRRAFVTIVVFVVLGVGGLTLVYPSGLPSQVTRALSTVMSVDEREFFPEAQAHGLSYEVGWTSGFRAAMYRIAFKRIKEHPIAGNGFSFSLKEILDEYYALTVNTNFKGIGALALAGGYHNSLLALAVFCGIPAMLVFLVGLLIIFYKFLTYARNLPTSPDKILASSLAGYFIASTGQMLMNGGSYDLVSSSVQLAVMAGILQKQAVAAREPVPERNSVTSLSAKPRLSPFTGYTV